MEIKGAKHNNLKDIDVKFHWGIYGYNWSKRLRKVSLISGTLAPALQRHLHRSEVSCGKHKQIKGLEKIDKAIVIDQSPIGRTPRSNPATYTKVFDEIRKLFSETKLSKQRGYKPGHFSFNVKGGRCEACSGGGSIKLEMNSCRCLDNMQGCEGKSTQREPEVSGRAEIFDIQMPVEEAVKFFANHRKIHRTLETLCAVGLDYITWATSDNSQEERHKE